MKKFLIAAALLLPAISYPMSPTLAFSTSAKEGQMITVKVKGLFCDLCRVKMEKSFEKLKGVNSVQVNLDSGIVKLGIKPGHNITDDAINAIVTRTGYTPVTIYRN